MARKPNLNSLRMFDAAARHLNFRLAAEELNLTQGAVADRVRQLEASLGVQFFHRKARGLEITDAGRTYHTAVHRGLNIIDDATRQLIPAEAKVVISTTPSFAAKWLVRQTGRFAAAFPHIDLQVEADDVVSDFKHTAIDFAIRLCEPPTDPGLRSELFAPLDLCAVCAPDFAGTMGTVHQAKDLFDYPLVQDAHNRWQNMADRTGTKHKPKIQQFNQTSLGIDAAINGQGIALVPSILVEQELVNGGLVEVWRDDQPVSTGYYLVYPKRHRNSPSRDAVIQWLLERRSGDVTS